MKYSRYDPPYIRFWGNVTKTNGCWNWTGYISSKGYGRFMVGKEIVSVHRLSYELHIGMIPDGKYICHHCDNPICVNPSHLYPGTHNDNMRDMRIRGRSLTGEKNGRSKLTWKDVDEIRLLHSSGIRQSRLAKRFGVHRNRIGKIVHNKIWVR